MVNRRQHTTLLPTVIETNSTSAPNQHVMCATMPVDEKMRTKSEKPCETQRKMKTTWGRALGVRMVRHMPLQLLSVLG